MAEILWNENLENYTFKSEINRTKSIKRVPIKFKIDDKTARFRRDLLKKKILGKIDKK